MCMMLNYGIICGIMKNYGISDSRNHLKCLLQTMVTCWFGILGFPKTKGTIGKWGISTIPKHQVPPGTLQKPETIG